MTLRRIGLNASFFIVMAGVLGGGCQFPLPDETGPYSVGYDYVNFEAEAYGKYSAMLFYPAVSNGHRQPKDTSGGPYPGMIVANGFGGSDWNITWIPIHLATYGYVALVFTPPNPMLSDPRQWGQGFMNGLNKLEDENAQAFSMIQGLLDPDTVGAIGLSMGGAGCLLATAADPRIDAAVALAPAYFDLTAFEVILGPLVQGFTDVFTAAASITVPMQLQVGTNDAFVPPERVYAAYEDIPTTTIKEFVEINGASHGAYVDLWVCPIADLIEQVLGNRNTIGFEAQHRIASRYFTSWFQYHLKGLAEYEPYIFGPEAQKDMDTGLLSALEYNIP